MSLPQDPVFIGDPPPPVRKNNTVLWVLLILGVGALCVGGVILTAILFPVFSQARLAATRTNCLTNIKQVGLAHIIYSAEFDDKLPLGPDWHQAVAKYQTDEAAFHCPVAAKDHGPESFGYGFNEGLAGAGLVAVGTAQRTILIFESQDLSASFVGGESDLANPARHLNGGNFAMADSSARFIKYQDPAEPDALKSYFWKP